MENNITLSDTVGVTLVTQGGLVFEVKGDPNFGDMKIVDAQGMEAVLTDAHLSPKDVDGMIDALTKFKEKYFNIPHVSTRSRKSKNPGTLFSRQVALAVGAFLRGTWSSGAVINRDEVFAALMGKYSRLETEHLNDITPKALATLVDLRGNALLTNDQYDSLNSMISDIEYAHSR